MRDIILKLAVLTRCVRLKYLRSDFSQWRKDYWSRDLDDLWCCSGFDSYGQVGCGCYGATIRDELLGRLQG